MPTFALVLLAVAGAAFMLFLIIVLRVNTDDPASLASFVYFEARFDSSLVEAAPWDALPEGWDAWPYTNAPQEVGNRWFDAGASLAMAVPSAVVPIENHYLINPLHGGYADMIVQGPFPVPFDTHLARTASK